MKDYHVDAFAKNVFTGNPAVVCVLDHWPDDGLMQQIAIENNLSETAYTVPEGDDYRLRWFTPGGEIDLCGHATLATAFVLANFIEPERQVFHFHTLGGDLTVRREGELFSMDFPAYAMQPVAVTAAMTAAIGRRPLAAYMARDLVCIMDDEDFVRQAEPNQEKIRELDGLLLHITAKGRDYDCVSRSFAPKLRSAVPATVIFCRFGPRVRGRRRCMRIRLPNEAASCFAKYTATVLLCPDMPACIRRQNCMYR